MKRILLTVLLIASAVLVAGAASGDAIVVEDLFTILSKDITAFEGVSLRTELKYYAEGTQRVLVYWENNAQGIISYGNMWQLQKYNGKTKKWEFIDKDGEGKWFTLEAYPVSPGKIRKMIYNIYIYDDNITPGLYRILTDCSGDNYKSADNEYGKIYLSAEFAVTADKNLLSVSELDYDDLDNSRIVFEDKSIEHTEQVYVYKNIDTFDTTVVINGRDYYKIAGGSGKWGVTSCGYYSDGGRGYLIYPFSRGEPRRCYIGVFDLMNRTETILPESFDVTEVGISARGDFNNFELNVTHYEVYYGEHEESGKYGGSGSVEGYLGEIRYTGGEFVFTKIEKNLFQVSRLSGQQLSKYKIAVRGLRLIDKLFYQEALMELRELFNENVLYYDRHRPTYGTELYRDVIAYSGLDSTKHAIEVGCGTGQATRPFLETGCRVTAVELGQNLAEFTREKYKDYKNLDIVVMPFEDYEAPGEGVDLIYSATAFHWVSDGRTGKPGYPKARAMLKPGGTLAVWWNTPRVSEENMELKNEIDGLYKKYLNEENEEKAVDFDEYYKKRCSGIQSQFKENGYNDIYFKIFNESRELSADDYYGLLHTYSGHMKLEQPIRDEFFGKMRDAVSKHGKVKMIDTIDLHMGRK